MGKANTEKGVCSMKKIRYYFTDFTVKNQELINKLREDGKFVYHLRDYDSDEGNGFTIEKRVWVNRLGFLITDTDLTKLGNDIVTVNKSRVDDWWIDHTDFWSLEERLVEDRTILNI